MSPAIVDSNVLLDLMTQDPTWPDRSATTLEAAADTSRLVINFIGAHAAVSGYRLITRDAARYRTYFPRLEVVAPN